MWRPAAHLRCTAGPCWSVHSVPCKNCCKHAVSNHRLGGPRISFSLFLSVSPWSGFMSCLTSDLSPLRCLFLWRWRPLIANTRSAVQCSRLLTAPNWTHVIVEDWLGAGRGEGSRGAAGRPGHLWYLPACKVNWGVVTHGHSFSPLQSLGMHPFKRLIVLNNQSRLNVQQIER